MSWWILKDVSEKLEFLRKNAKCKRCGLYYRRELVNCDNCSNLSDTELNVALGKRGLFRTTLGKKMLYGAIIIVVVMVALATQLT